MPRRSAAGPRLSAAWALGPLWQPVGTWRCGGSHPAVRMAGVAPWRPGGGAFVSYLIISLQVFVQKGCVCQDVLVAAAAAALIDDDAPKE